MAKIKVFTTKRTGLTTIEADITSWSELLHLVKQKGLYEGDMKAVVRETQHEFGNGGDALPTGLGYDDDNIQSYDFTLFLSARKTKSGLINQ